MTTPDALQLTPTARDFERNLRAWVAEGSGLHPQFVIPGEVDRPAPNGLYASVYLIAPRIVGLPYFRRERNEDGVRIDQDTIAWCATATRSSGTARSPPTGGGSSPSGHRRQRGWSLPPVRSLSTWIGILRRPTRTTPQTLRGCWAATA